MTWDSQRDKRTSAHHALRGKPLPGASPEDEREALGATMGALWNWVSKHPELDIEQARQYSESSDEEIHGETFDDEKATLQDAAELQTETEIRRQDPGFSHEQRTASDAAIERTSKAKSAMMMASAIKTLAEAASILRQNGGDVRFDFPEIYRQFVDLIKEHPAPASAFTGPIKVPPNIKLSKDMALGQMPGDSAEVPDIDQEPAA